MANGKIIQLKELDDLSTPIYPVTKADAVYLQNGSLLTDYLRGYPQGTIGAANQPIYLHDGVLTPLTSTIGATNQIVYLDNGVFKEGIKTINENEVPEFRTHIIDNFAIAKQVNGTWTDNNVWWRIFKSEYTDVNYNNFWLELTIVNLGYSHHPPSISKFLLSPCYQTSNGTISRLDSTTAPSCTGIRFGRNPNDGYWYVDLKLRTNFYDIYAQGRGVTRLPSFSSKVSNSGFTYNHSWGEA